MGKIRTNSIDNTQYPKCAVMGCKKREGIAETEIINGEVVTLLEANRVTEPPRCRCGKSDSIKITKAKDDDLRTLIP